MNIFKLWEFNLVMAPDEGSDGAGAGAGGAGGEGQGNQGSGQQNQGDGSQNAGQGNQGGDDAGAGAGKGAGGEEKPWFDEKWRERLATKADGTIDEKRLNRLKRMNSPADLGNSYFSLDQKISTGELRAPLPKDATPEQVAEYRKINGIPDKPEAYLEGLPKGLVFGEGDKAVLDPFLKDMHDANVPPAAVQRALAAYQQSREGQTAAIQERDLQIAEATEDELRTEWGTDYRANANAVEGFIKAYFPADVEQALRNARLGDEGSTPLMHNPHILRAFATLGRTLNPASTITHGSSQDTMGSINEQIAAYEKRMGTDKSWYNDEKANSHYRELITIRDRMKQQAA